MASTPPPKEPKRQTSEAKRLAEERAKKRLEDEKKQREQEEKRKKERQEKVEKGQLIFLTNISGQKQIVTGIRGESITFLTSETKEFEMSEDEAKERFAFYLKKNIIKITKK